MSIVLPEKVPFNDPVTVCAECRKACCALERFRCDDRKRGPVPTIAIPLASLLADPQENRSYWKPQRPDGDDDIPIDVEDMEELIASQRERPNAEREMVAGYLEHELGIDPAQVAAAMAAKWPEELA